MTQVDPKVLITLFLALCLPSVSQGQCPGSPPSGIECVNTSAQKEITAHSECRSVTNNHASSKSILVPTKTSTEWSTFYTQPPSGVTIAACAPDPCNGKSIGQACTGTTALYAGVFDSGRYMITPSGCQNSTNNPNCPGTQDSIFKTWNNGSGTAYDIPTIANVTGASTPSTERGHYTTPIIAAITLTAEGGVHLAAKHCFDLDYGGFSDWYLPSKSEMAYIYCKSSPVTHNSSYPQENPNCGGSGPTSQLTGFIASDYWTSTEDSSTTARRHAFTNGNQQNLAKGGIGYIRCIRRY